MQDTGKSLYELRRGNTGKGRNGSAYKMKQRFSCGRRRRRAGDWFILGRLCTFPFPVSIFILFFFLLLCCFCFCFVFSALGQADITPLRGRHKKAATVLRPHRMKMSTTWRTTTSTTTVPFQRIANWNWNWKKRNETKRRKNWTEMNSGR